MNRAARRHRTEAVRARRLRDVLRAMIQEGTRQAGLSSPDSERELRRAAKKARTEHPFGCPTGRCRCGACSRVPWGRKRKDAELAAEVLAELAT